MTNPSESPKSLQSIALDVLSSVFGALVLAIGVVNTFWGNDPGFGAFLVLLSLIYFPPIDTVAKKIIGFRIPRIAKILLGIFIIWAAMGVGELFDKIDLMMKDLL